LLRFQSFSIAAFFLADQLRADAPSFPAVFFSFLAPAVFFNKEVLEPVAWLNNLFALIAMDDFFFCEPPTLRVTFFLAVLIAALAVAPLRADDVVEPVALLYSLLAFDVTFFLAEETPALAIARFLSADVVEPVAWLTSLFALILAAEALFCEPPTLRVTLLLAVLAADLTELPADLAVSVTFLTIISVFVGLAFLILLDIALFFILAALLASFMSASYLDAIVLFLFLEAKASCCYLSTASHGE